MDVTLTEKILAAVLTVTFIFALALAFGNSTNTIEPKEVEFYVVCPYGEDTCTPYHPYEVKVIYK